jgi:hypothetical protein
VVRDIRVELHGHLVKVSMDSPLVDIALSLAVFVLILLHLVRVRLRQCHSELFSRLGNPAFNDSYLRSTYWKLQRFIWWDHFFLKDGVVHFLCVLTCVGELLFAVIWFLPIDARITKLLTSAA